MEITASLENYLEVIASLSDIDGYALSNDIADKMSVKRSSVTVALRNLSECELIVYKKYKPITLTPKGKKLADQITYTHKIVKTFLKDLLGVDEKVADRIACEMEHFIGAEVTNRLVAFTNYIKLCPRSAEKWLEGFEAFYKDGRDTRTCSHCNDTDED